MKDLILFILCFSIAAFAKCDNCEQLKYYTETAVFETDSGKIRLAFFEQEAPEHVKNFKELVRSGYYSGKTFHRVISDFVIQAGRDSVTGYSSVEPEIKKIHFRGALAAARMGDDINPGRRSDGYEFYICLKPLPDLDGKYTVFGRTAEGFETVKKISAAPTGKGDIPLKEITIRKAYLDTWFDYEKYEYFENSRRNADGT
jgi:cyclophilin family peptidyl-prolyl cis-trans isomerase